MKNKWTLSFAAAVALALLSASCNNNKPEDSKNVAEESNEAKFKNNDAEKDAQFLVDAATISMEEIRLGQLAKEKGMMQEVKDLGKMMETDHTKALEETKALAAKKSVSLPVALPDKVESDVTKFIDKKGRDFDKDYCDKMVDGHKDAISKFEKASTDAQDEEIRNFASQMLPALRQHLEHAQNCQKACEKNK